MKQTIDNLESLKESHLDKIDALESQLSKSQSGSSSSKPRRNGSTKKALKQLFGGDRTNNLISRSGLRCITGGGKKRSSNPSPYAQLDPSSVHGTAASTVATTGHASTNCASSSSPRSVSAPVATLTPPSNKNDSSSNEDDEEPGRIPCTPQASDNDPFWQRVDRLYGVIEG